MSKEKQEQITLWEGSLDDHPTWRFYQEEISRVYHDLYTDRDRPYVDYELIKRAGKVAYVNHLEDDAVSFLMQYAKMTRPQADNLVESISKEIGRVVLKREDE